MSYGDQRGPKRDKRRDILPPPRHAGRVLDVRKETDVADVINQALGIIKQQVDTIAAKSRLGGLLPEHEVKALGAHIKSLVELSREDRERTKHDGIEEWLANLSTEELVQLAQGKVAQSANMDTAIEVKKSDDEGESK